MTETVWRIATEAPGYSADDLSGKGAEVTGGRWNAPGHPVVYTSQSRALACLETVVHLNAGALPLNRYLVAVEIPDDVWGKAQTEDEESVPVAWGAEPAGKASIDFGTNWLIAKNSALLVVPSVIVPEERNVLINPRHPDSARIGAMVVRKWTYDSRVAR